MDHKILDKKFKKFINTPPIKGLFKREDILDRCDYVIVITTIYKKAVYKIFTLTKKRFKEMLVKNEELNDESKYFIRYLKLSNPKYNTNKLPNRLLDQLLKF